MKIAIHKCPGSFSDEWIDYCKENDIYYKTVNCIDSNIVEQLADCDGLLWHWPHWDFKATLFARQLISSLEMMGKKVFPSSKTCWHYDDKIGQKYLFEGIGAPLIPSYIFYEKNDAFEWIERTTFPKVFKLRCGASSMNVKLVKNKREARLLNRKAFTKGFPIVDRLELLKDRLWHLRRDKNCNALIGLFKGFARLLVPTDLENIRGREKGYVYFQDFIEGLDGDYRVIVIGSKAFAMKRLVREGDFRASGSGVINESPELINPELIKISFMISKKLGLQSAAFDLIIKDQKIYLIEVSYAFMAKVLSGYWDENLQWIPEKTNLRKTIIQDFIQSLS